MHSGQTVQDFSACGNQYVLFVALFGLSDKSPVLSGLNTRHTVCPKCPEQPCYKGLRVGSEEKSRAVCLKPARSLPGASGNQSHCTVCDFSTFARQCMTSCANARLPGLGGKQYVTFYTPANSPRLFPPMSNITILFCSQRPKWLLAQVCSETIRNHNFTTGI